MGTRKDSRVQPSAADSSALHNNKLRLPPSSPLLSLQSYVLPPSSVFQVKGWEEASPARKVWQQGLP